MIHISKGLVWKIWKGSVYVYETSLLKLFESLISISDSWQHSVTIQIEVNIGLRGVFECAADGNSA
jgi:hypothetical protein